MAIPEEQRKEAMDTQTMFNEVVEGVSRTFMNEERHLRHAAYERFGMVISSLLSGSGTSEAVHTHPIEIAEERGRRTIFLCRDRVPAHGTLVRVIINEEFNNPVEDRHFMSTSDFVVSTIQKTLTFQQTSLTRSNFHAPWPTTQDSGPRLLLRKSNLEVVSGSEYSVHIPKTSGYPHMQTALMEQRVQLESLNDNLSSLNGGTVEPGYPSPAGIMS